MNVLGERKRRTTAHGRSMTRDSRGGMVSEMPGLCAVLPVVTAEMLFFCFFADGASFPRTTRMSLIRLDRRSSLVVGPTFTAGN